ncbi:isochorismatase family protein [Citrobacter sp. BDA59-3]|uniref:isochorismatase family protein n=1 Tax=Citrobacter sp. BDA59-3 TaxID=2781952 RepID=UPI001D150D28|nr:isochorismatase family protein [Citrobacter sp. BDA59-3]
MQRRDFINAGSALLGATILGMSATANADNKKKEVNNHGLSGSRQMTNRFSVEKNDALFIFADLHPSLVNTCNTLSPDSLTANVGGLAKCAKAVSAPAYFLTVTQNGKPGELVPSLREYANMNNTIFRKMADPFQVSEITDAIERSGRKTLVVAGYTAEVAVLLTTLGGIQSGYKVFIPVDCIGSRSSRTEDAALRQAEQAGGVITSLSTLAAQLAPDFSQEPGKTILSVIASIKA